MIPFHAGGGGNSVNTSAKRQDMKRLPSFVGGIFQHSLVPRVGPGNEATLHKCSVHYTVANNYTWQCNAEHRPIFKRRVLQHHFIHALFVQVLESLVHKLR